MERITPSSRNADDIDEINNNPEIKRGFDEMNEIIEVYTATYCNFKLTIYYVDGWQKHREGLPSSRGQILGRL